MSAEHLTLSEIKTFFKFNMVWKAILEQVEVETQRCLEELLSENVSRERAMFLRGELHNMNALENIEEMLVDQIQSTFDTETENGIIQTEDD